MSTQRAHTCLRGGEETEREKVTAAGVQRSGWYVNLTPGVPQDLALETLTRPTLSSDLFDLCENSEVFCLCRSQESMDRTSSRCPEELIVPGFQRSANQDLPHQHGSATMIYGYQCLLYC